MTLRLPLTAEDNTRYGEGTLSLYQNIFKLHVGSKVFHCSMHYILALLYLLNFIFYYYLITFIN